MSLLFWIRGRPTPDREWEEWKDHSGGATAIWLSLKSAERELQHVIAAGWCDIEILSCQMSCTNRRLEAKGNNNFNRPEDHPLAGGINPPTKEEPLDETLQRLHNARMLSQNEWNPHNCYLSPTEQARAAKLLDW